jgi:hypothetical protein
LEKKRFDWKSFISFGLFFSFFVIALTGLVLYIAPPGRVAKWVNWELIGLSKEGWQALHTNFSYLFLVLSIFHLFSINWKVFWSYVKRRAGSGVHRKKELAAGTILFLVVFLGTLFQVPPMQTVMDIGEYFTESWEKKEEKAPMPHTEALTVVEVSEKLVKMSPGEIVKKLEAAGLKNVGKEMTLKEIGEENGTSPFEIYQMIVADAEIRKMDFGALKEGSGIGRKTLSEISELTGVPVEVLVQRFKAAGIEATTDEKLKEIANRTGKTPFELVELLKREK